MSTVHTYKILGQSIPTSNSLTTLYTVPSSGQSVSSSIVCCNQNASYAKIRISVAIAGAADTLAQYLAYDLQVPGNESYIATIGISLQATDVVRVQSDTGNVSFNLFGDEIT